MQWASNLRSDATRFPLRRYNREVKHMRKKFGKAGAAIPINHSDKPSRSMEVREKYGIEESPD